MPRIASVSHHPLELAGLEQVAREEVDPDALAERRDTRCSGESGMAQRLTLHRWPPDCEELMNDVERWRELGQQLRVDSIRPSAIAGSGHPTSGMSAADLMAVLVDAHLALRLGQTRTTPRTTGSSSRRATRRRSSTGSSARPA